MIFIIIVLDKTISEYEDKKYMLFSGNPPWIAS